MSDPYHWLEQSLRTIHQAHWYRQVYPIESPPGPMIEMGGQSLINFASNDYLGLANDPRLKRAAIEAIQYWGTGSTGSRLLSGQRPLHHTLEQAIARWKGTEAAVVFSSGYLANLGTLMALVGKRDLILGDEYNHSSLKRGAQLSGASYESYDHSNLGDLEQKLLKLRQNHRRSLIVTDGIFSMDGDICPLPGLIRLAESYDCMLLVDEAHATGILGKGGAGCRAYFAGLTTANFIQMGTLSKALGSLGGYIAGSADLIDYLRNRAATWIYTTGLSPADTAAAIAAIEVIHQEPQRLQQLWLNVHYLKEHLAQLRYPLLPSNSPILCIQLPQASDALQLSEQLQKKGIFAPAIRPPTVPTSRLRFSVMATHTVPQLDQLIQALS